MKLKIVILLLSMLIPVVPATAQKKSKKITFSGFVIDSKGNPVSNSMFCIDDIKNQVLTNADGSFKFKVKPETKKIMTYSLEYGSAELIYNGEESHIFKLENISESPVDVAPEEVGETVNIGYGIANKDELSTSVGSVDKEKIAKYTYSTIYEMIVGQVPGVYVNGSSIMIRGESSLKGGSTPLLVVDGIPVTSIGNISPNDVESIDILKGSASSIYGTRGANGVILIKTKRNDK
jgi:TonB-dependent SusC/RagA subfamily outer membrane receptor